jgi:hypothetical protein
MSELRADTITASDGTSPVTLTKQSAAKSWNHINTGFAVSNSLNVASVVDDGGNAPNTWTVNLTNAMSSTAYVVSGTSSGIAPRFVAVDYLTASSYQCANYVSNSPTSGTGNVAETQVTGDLA